MKKLILVLSLVALSLVSCSKEPVPCNCKVYLWEEYGYDYRIYEPELDTLIFMSENECNDYEVKATQGHGSINSSIDCN